MKKNGLFKIISVLIILLAVLSWIIPASYYGNADLVNLGLYRVGFSHLFQYPLSAVKYFTDIIVFILIVGAFYGILGKTGKYRTMVEKLSNKIKGKEKLYLILVAIIFASLSSIFGFGLLLFIFIPFIISITLLIGYDKLTAFLLTFGSVLVGQLGSIYNFNILSFINKATSTTYTTQIYVKIGIFVITLAILIMFTLKHATKVLDKKPKSTDTVDAYLGEKRTTKRKMWHLIAIFSVLFVLLVLGCTHWKEVFNIDIFNTLDTTIKGVKIKNFAVFASFLGEIKAFGMWTYTEMSSMLLIASVLITIIYKLKIKDAIDGAWEGINKIMKPTLLITLSFVVLIITAYHPFFTTAAGWITDLTKHFNMFTTMFTTVFSSLLNIDMTYVAQCSVPYIAGIFPSDAALNSLALITQVFYGLTMFVAPTSTLLILGLEYAGIPYVEYLKKTWKLIVSLLIIIVIIVIAASLI
ncbi:MAG: hypothetical protein RR228_02245 [Bacilli bacterium]